MTPLPATPASAPAAAADRLRDELTALADALDTLPADRPLPACILLATEKALRMMGPAPCQACHETAPDLKAVRGTEGIAFICKLCRDGADRAAAEDPNHAEKTALFHELCATFGGNGPGRARR